MLNAFFDGSGPGHNNGRYAMAGFVAFCPTWADIADDWARVRDETPAIPKFKLSLSRSKEWRDQVGICEDQMGAKIERFSALVAPPKTLFSVVTSISESEFKQVIAETGVLGNKQLRSTLGKFTFKTAYTFLFHNVVALTLDKIQRLGIVGDQVDLVFDRENELFDGANSLLRKTRRFFDPSFYAMLGDAVQRDEDKVLPLQAADLIAGRVKDHCNDPQNVELRSRLVEITGTGDHNITRHISEQYIRTVISAVLQPMPKGWKPLYDWGVGL